MPPSTATTFACGGSRSIAAMRAGFVSVLVPRCGTRRAHSTDASRVPKRSAYTVLSLPFPRRTAEAFLCEIVQRIVC
jgi:hypothetical protein